MKNSIFLIVTFLCLNGFSQDIEIGQWRDYLPYNSGQYVEKMNSKIYIATQNSLFYYHLNDNTLNRLSKTNGLSDVNISVMKKSLNDDLIIVAYQNASIDIISQDGIENISDIKRANIIGLKSINNIAFYGQEAYLSCSFGIVQLDLEKNEVKSTYFLNKNQNLSVNDLVFYNDTIFAATDSGIYKGGIENNLNDYRMWHPMPNAQKITELELSQNTIYYTQLSDSIFSLVNGQGFFIAEEQYLRKIKVIEEELYVLSRSKLKKLNSTGLELLSESSFLYKANDVIKEESNFWIADGGSALILVDELNNYRQFKPEGPESDFVFSLSVSENNLFVSPGGISIIWNNNNTYKGFYWFDSYSWNNLNYNQLGETDIRDITTILQGPSQSLFLATWNDGIIQLKKEQNGYEYDKSHNFFTTNGQIQSLSPEPSSSSYGRLRIKGLVFDNNGDLWATNSLVEKGLTRMDPQGEWQSYKIKSYNTLNDHLGDLIIDDYNQKWFYVAKGGGLLVYNDNNTPELENDDNDIHLTTTAGQGGLPSNSIYSLAKDLEGQIWIGTDKGLAVFYDPQNIFNENIIDAQQVLVEVDGYVEPILNNESITAIAIDGANRKWFGTQSSGLFVYSSDGSEQLQHFTENNSPLFSNSISSLAINQENGEVFVGTSKGLISYRSGAIEGGDTHSDVLVYPNPVRENYDGPIAIKGLVKDANVKITDINGSLVSELTALGGQAVWGGKNGDGIKASTGVYLVFTTNSNGTETNVAKILLIK